MFEQQQDFNKVTIKLFYLVVVVVETLYNYIVCCLCCFVLL